MIGDHAPLAKETPATQTSESELLYIVNDHLGTPHEMFSEDGSLQWAAQYRTWGGVRKIWQAENDNTVRGPYPPVTRGALAIKYETVAERAAQDCPIRFQGQYEDAETGLYYNRYRYYDPLVGQYLSPDPLGLGGGLRPNGYVHNPNQWIDPLGLAPKIPLTEPLKQRHDPTKVTRKSVIKEKNTMVDSSVNMKADIDLINTGQGIRNGDTWTVIMAVPMDSMRIQEELFPFQAQDLQL